MITLTGYKIVDANGAFLTSTVFPSLEEANKYISECKSSGHLMAIPTSAVVRKNGQLSEMLTERL